MKKLPHTIFTIFLVSVGLLTAVSIWIKNYTYYLLPLDERPTHALYEELKPSGFESHGYGIIGTAMIFIGVAIYSSRKRVRRLAHLGKIKDYLEFHIFMCLVGPILVLYHTTFKFGGIAAVGFWSMSAVVLSGFIGRYFYRHIPKNIEGQELTAKDLEEERSRLLQSVKEKHNLDSSVIDSIESIGTHKFDESKAGLIRLTLYLFAVDFSRARRVKMLKKTLREHSIPENSVREIARVANDRIVLRQRILALEKLRQVFHYWHVIHLPFSIVMLAILIVHVGVAVALGYTWIWK
ncbi:MAG TPA: hypothetical protein VIS48_11270 [Candidatus Kryptonia bacterium]